MGKREENGDEEHTAKNEWRSGLHGLNGLIHRILQCRRRLFGPSSLHWLWFHPGPIPITPCIHPRKSPWHEGAIQHGQSTKSAHLWTVGETGAPGGNPRRQGENVQTPHREWPSPESNPGPWRCEAAVLTTVPPCCSYILWTYEPTFSESIPLRSIMPATRWSVSSVWSRKGEDYNHEDRPVAFPTNTVSRQVHD